MLRELTVGSEPAYFEKPKTSVTSRGESIDPGVPPLAGSGRGASGSRGFSDMMRAASSAAELIS